MIITLKGANFSTHNIGALNLYSVTLSKTGASGTLLTTSFEKNQVVSSATVIANNLAASAGYENLAVTVTMGGTSVNAWYSNGTVTIPSNTTITGDIKINASATAVSGGEEDEPVTPTTYTFTINPTPTTATVTLTASGYTQSGNSITVSANTVVTWKVSASGYTEQTGTHTVTKTESKSVTLSEHVASDEIMGTWQFNIDDWSMSYNTEFGGKAAKTYWTELPYSAYKGYKVNYTFVARGKETTSDYLLTHTTVDMLAYNAVNADGENYASTLWHNGSWQLENKQITITSPLSEIESGEVLLAFLNKYATKIL